ncbi:MAG: hypothetical protein JF888_01455 [Candidatus Dormibacteraeota bacterium]|uniref:Uncharacterized protein n=1 Tax=Candidatus Dormiibacter inghamiae TaxID=3127013 RepID=A0A934K7J5_9BACT|nr:hypothetical protein [Candidatus Dormibacteraeota bacterium]MBJ7605557.1 hypothetical protein [Candidatus Dormibacteraeota bacterium]
MERNLVRALSLADLVGAITDRRIALEGEPEDIHRKDDRRAALFAGARGA